MSQTIFTPLLFILPLGLISSFVFDWSWSIDWSVEFFVDSNIIGFTSAFLCFKCLDTNLSNAVGLLNSAAIEFTVTLNPSKIVEPADFKWEVIILLSIVVITNCYYH